MPNPPVWKCPIQMVTFIPFIMRWCPVLLWCQTGVGTSASPPPVPEIPLLEIRDTYPVEAVRRMDQVNPPP
ncbi:hypothetical protein TNCV_1812801 [Trichonephila clavipes]|uniref:Secreted protein n=1 Tax=Trichonephila clavipes TaxID=2585209 RepID=A0A8X7BFE4_TRICX|nr:hypothetical protein TNCV_1812801 [Trichonephila clavipes]